MKRFLILMALAASLLLSGCARGEITVELSAWSGGPYGQALSRSPSCSQRQTFEEDFKKRWLYGPKSR